jgi:hypothetical protein
MILLLFYLELGWIPEGALLAYNPSEYYEAQEDLYAELGTEAQLLGFYFGGTVKTLSNWGFGGFFSNTIQYSFSGGWKNEWFDIGFRKYCGHPIVPYYGMISGDVKYDYYSTEVFLRISNR